MKGRAEILMILLVLMSLLAVPAGASYGNEYIMNFTIQEDTIRFADHASAIDGNWIKLSGSGEEIQLPYPLTFTYNGVSSTSLTVHGEQIDIDLNIEEFVDHTIYYPYLTHPVYVNDSVQNRVIMDFDGAAYFANSEVELHLIEASISELYSALYELINGGEISPLFNIVSDSQYWEVQLDAQGDLSMDLGYLPAGDYIILITYPDESVFLSVSAFMVLESACQVTAVDTGDELLLDVQLLNIPEQAEHIYEAVLIKTSEYRAEMYMEFDGTKDGIALSLNDVPIMDGPSFVGFKLADPKASDIREKLNDMIGEERIAMAYGPGPDLSLPINSMEPGDYMLLTLVRDNANVLAFSQSEISLDNFQLSNAVVVPDTAVRGENITVSVDLNNPRDVERYEVIGLNASWMPAGQTIDQVFVLGPDDSCTIDFDIMVPQNADLGTASIIVAGNSSSVSLNVTVAEPMPVASFTVNETSGFAPMSIELIDGSVNSAANVWDLGDGTVVQDMSTLVHTYGLPGVYNVTLTVFNVENVSDSSSKLISVGLKVPPIQVPSIPKGASNASKKDLVNDLSVPPSFVNSTGVRAYEYIVTTKNDTSPANVSVNISLKAPVGVTNITDIGNGTLPDFYYSVSIDDENWYEDISEIQLRIYYDRARVNALGIDENTLRPVRFTNGEWVRLNTPGTLADGTELFASGVVTVGDDPYVWANISRFSNYGVAGQILSPATPAPEEDSDRSSNRVRASAVSIEPSENVILRESQSNAIWKDVPVRFEFKDTPVSSISFIPRINVGNSNMIVETLKEPSKLTERAPPGIVFEHLNIWTPHQFKNEFFENIVVEFAIDKAWLMENEAEPESVKLLRYTHEWKSLPTTVLREDADMVYYQAVIPGFSAFTIVADVDGEMMVEGYELKADFIAVPLQGQSPLEVSFEDRSHNAVSWYWDLGDGTSSTEQNPVHTYEEPGIYTVTLTVSNVDGSETLAISREINVVDDDTGIPGFEIAFAIISLLAVAALFRRKKEI